MTYKIKYRKQEELKDSCIEWLVKEPIDWDIRKIKYITSEIKNGIWGVDEKQDQNDIACIRVANFNRDNNSIDIRNLTIRNLDQIKQKEYLLKKGDLLIEKSGGGINQPVGFTTIYEHNISAIYANFMAKISITDKNVNKYILYYFRHLYDKRVNAKFINQTTGIQNINTTAYFDEKIILPGFSEQEKIANFLDIKTSKFDSIISKKELLIEKLEEARKSLISEVVTGKVKIVDGELVARKSHEMKDSGVEWLGMVPKDWEVGSLRWYLNCRSGDFISNLKVANNSLNSHTIPVIGGNGLMGYSEKYNTAKETIAIGRVGALCGNVHLIDYKAWITDNSLIINHNQKEFNIKYLAILVKNINLNKYSTSTAQPLITGETVKKRRVVIPHIHEQKIIADFLDIKTADFDSIINTNKTQINKLKEAKQSLISEAVTGKIDLRDWEIEEV